MSVEILEGDDGRQVLFCNTTDWAFGPVFGSDEDALDFLEWLPRDARSYNNNDLEDKHFEWQNERKRDAAAA